MGMKKKGFAWLALAGLFVLGVVAGGIAAPDLPHAYAQTTCEEDECDSPPWWKFWASDECVMNVGNQTGCNVIVSGCETYACGQVIDPTYGSEGGEEPKECRESDGTWICL